MHSNGSEAARLREMAAQYRRLAANVTDPAMISVMRGMANDYEADADDLEAQSPRLSAPVVQSAAMAIPTPGAEFGCPLESLLKRQVLETRFAVPLMFAAILAPTLLRAGVSGFVAGNEFLAYVPFVFFAALLLKPWSAGVVAIGSALAADFFFMEPQFQFAAAPADLFGVGVFLACCGMTICLVRAFRLAVSSADNRQPLGSTLLDN